jgi:hypothetical protein
MQDQHYLAQDYGTALGTVRTALAGGGPYPRTLPGANANPVAQSVSLAGAFDVLGIRPVTLIYKRANAYIYGYAANGRTVRFGGPDAAAVVPVADDTLPFDPDYAAMGWQKNLDMRTVKLDAVGVALSGLAEGTAVSKGDMIAILVGFAEAARFRDIEEAVTEGKAIDGKRLDWSSQRAPGDLLLKQA